MPNSIRHLLVVTLVAATSVPASAGPAINQFETKDLDSAPGEMQFQSQNAISFGQPRRKLKETEPGEFSYDDNTVTRERYALEMQMGLTTWFRTRVGIEFEKERIDDPASPARANAFEDLHLTGIAVEGVFIFKPVKRDGVGLGMLVEFDAAVRGGTNQLYAGPIIQAVSGPWSALANLLVVQHFGQVDRKQDFAYAAQLQYEASPTWAFALEAYGTVDRLGNSGTPPPSRALFGDFEQHRLGPIVYYRFNPGGGAHTGAKSGQVKGLRRDDEDAPGSAGLDGDDKDKVVSIGAGVLFGLNGNTPDQTFKLSLEVNF
jgi:hypothetical protein